MSAILLIVFLAIIGFNIGCGPRGYRRLVAAEAVTRIRLFRRMLFAQLLLFSLPGLAALALLGRLGTLAGLPVEFWPATEALGNDPAAGPNIFVIWCAVIALAVVVPLGALLTLRRVGRGKPLPRALERVAALSPQDRPELLLGAGIALAAGIGEELFFRLALPLLLLLLLLLLLVPVIGATAAILAAIVLFGLSHSYRGWRGVLVTGVVEAWFTLLVLITGSVVIPMLMHITIDMMALVVRPAIRGAWRQPASD